MRKSASDPRDQLIELLIGGVRDLLDSQTKLIKEVLTHRAIEEDVLRQNRFKESLAPSLGRIPSILNSNLPHDGPPSDWSPEAIGYPLGGLPFVPPPSAPEKKD